VALLWTTVCAESCHKVTELVGITDYIDRRDATIAHVERSRLKHVASIEADIAWQAIDRRGA
jgi:predicted dithiol-disulfide oxidoreductase (DUF899 family)